MTRDDETDVLEVDTRRVRRERMAWRAGALVLLVLGIGPAWNALTGDHAGAAADGGSSSSGRRAGADAGAPQPLEAGDPMPQEPNGVGDVTHLQPSVQRALDRATRAAADDGITLRVTSGWRSAEKQERLYQQAIAKYGSAEKARRWVLPPSESEHVKGGAIDVGPRSAASWLEEHGVRYGLCRRYENEPWHFELLAPHKGQACPAMEPHA
ncbi:M15 family metallopeptidase [Angustibacter peucedani]